MRSTTDRSTAAPPQEAGRHLPLRLSNHLPSRRRVSPDLDTPEGLAAHRFRAMGTEVHLLVSSARKREGGQLVEELFARWEGALSRFRPESELSRLNARAGHPVRVGDILLHAVEASVAAAEATGGLFDPTLHDELVRIGYAQSFDVIGAVEPSACRPGRRGAWRRIVTSRTARVVLLPPGCGLDLGGIAKGMAVDAAVEQLVQHGITPVLLSAGGDLAVHGVPPRARAWHVRVGERSDAPVVSLVRGAIATSGTARRRWLQGTVRRHHLLDPRTGNPADSGLSQVTVAAVSCREAEVAATAAFVAGAGLATRLLERNGVSGLLETDDGRSIAVGRWPSHDAVRAA